MGDALYVIDGTDKKQITDNYGNSPDFEYEDNWEGGSMSAKVYAVEKTDSGGYALLIKHTEEHDDDFHGYDDDDDVDTGDDDTEDTFEPVAHVGYKSSKDSIATATSADGITASDFPTAKSAADAFTGDITITFEPDNGWLDVNQTTSSATFQYLAGLNSPYDTASPVNSGSNAVTTRLNGSNGGDHFDGTAEGEILYMHTATGDFKDKKVVFGFEDVGHDGGPDESDLARLNSGSNIDRGINTTGVTSSAASSTYDQFLEILPSNDTSGGLYVDFYGTDNSGTQFQNPVDSFGFYLMGRQPKRDVILSVYDINGDVLYADVTAEPATLPEAHVDYITFTRNSEDAPIASFALTEVDPSASSQMRDIYSIDDLSLNFTDLSTLTTKPVIKPAAKAASSSSTSANEGDSDATTYWEVWTLDKDAKLDWSSGSVFTDSISGYEKVFDQDLDGDTFVGVNLYALDDVLTDTVGDTLMVSNEGTVHIWDDTAEEIVDVIDANGGSPSFVVNEIWPDGYFKINPYAVTRISGEGSDPDYFRLAIKLEDNYSFEGVDNSRTEWEIMKVSLAGVIDSSQTVRTPSITTWEDEFGQDMNGDKDFSGNITIKARSTDDTGALLGEADGQLFIVDGGSINTATDPYTITGGTQVPVNDSWIEENSSWGDGYFRSEAIAARKEGNGTEATGDDYYQVAVKQTNKWTNWEGVSEVFQNWQVYAVKQDGSIDWEKTIWTESIAGFESKFGQDLDGDGSEGVNVSKLTTASLDKNGYLLKKDAKKLLYITDNNGDNLIPITDEYGGYPMFDHSHNWGAGSHSSEAVAVEQTTDGFSLAVKRVDTFEGSTSTFWEILKLNPQGVLSWDSSIWTDDIALYEKTIFNDDLDGDGSLGLNLSGLIDVETTGDEKLKKDSKNNFYIEDGTSTLKIAFPWGGSPDYQVSESWGSGYTFTREAVAVADKTFTDSDGTSRDGYVVAIKNTFKDGSETHIDWQLDYVKPDGVIDEGKTEHKFSIKNDEAAFGMDLDGDEKEGFDVTDLEAVATDEVGDLLKKDGYAYYILDDNDTSTKSDDKTIALVDSWGDSPYFDYEWAYGSGDNAYSEKVSTFAVESFTEKGVKKFMLAVKREEQYGTADKETFWETFKIVESSPGAGDWALDWSTGAHTKGVRRLESTLNMDLNGNNVVDSGSVTTTNVATDTSRTGLAGVALALDSEGLMYIKSGSSELEIYDDNGSITFDHQETWGGITFAAEAYAVEGVLNEAQNAIASYVLLVKGIETDLSSDVSTTSWTTFSVDTNGLLDWQSEAWSDSPKPYEAVVNQDLDGDNKIWSISSESLSQVDTDTRGAKLYTDSDNNLYVQAAGASQKSQLLDDGRPLNLSYSFTDGDYTYSESPVAVDAIDLDSNGANDAYRLLVRQKEVDGSTIESSYYSVNANLTTLKVDWGSYSFYESAEAMEAAFDMDLDGDGSVFTIDSNKSTEVATDTTGAKLRTQNGNLFIKDGDTTIPIVGKNDGAPVMLNDSWTKVESDSTTTFKSEPIAVQKVTGGTTFKLVVKETTTYSQGEDVMSNQIVSIPFTILVL